MNWGLQTESCDVKVRRVNGAYAVIASRQVRRGAVIFKMRGRLTDRPSKYSIQLSEHQHLEPHSHDPRDVNSLIRFFNHSCSPSAYVSVEDLTARALYDLEPGEEVTYNYNTTEFEISSPFQCHCQAENCLSDIRGFRRLSREQQMALWPYLAPYLRECVSGWTEKNDEQESEY